MPAMCLRRHTAYRYCPQGQQAAYQKAPEVRLSSHASATSPVSKCRDTSMQHNACRPLRAARLAAHLTHGAHHRPGRPVEAGAHAVHNHWDAQPPHALERSAQHKRPLFGWGRPPHTARAHSALHGTEKLSAAGKGFCVPRKPGQPRAAQQKSRCIMRLAHVARA